MSPVPSAPKDNNPSGSISSQSPPTPDEVRTELAKVQSSDPFVRSERIKRLLTFLVESLLAGNQDFLKESIIGVEVFDRAPSYDCKQDPVVRVEMRRLRSKLSEYYLHAGKSDALVIWLDKGSYVPTLSKRAVDVPAPSFPAAQSAQLDSEAGVKAPGEPKLPDLAPPARHRGPRNAWIAAASAIVLIAVVLGIYFVRLAKSPQTFRVFPLAGSAGLETSPAFSPDGKQVAYSWDGNRQNFDIYVKAIEGGLPHRLTDNAAHDIDPSWSPDGSQIAFLRVFPAMTELLVIPFTGGVAKVVGRVATSVNRWHPEEPEQNGAGGPVWSPDGSYLLVSGSAKENGPLGILKFYTDGRQEQVTYPNPGAQDFTPRISPDGAAIAFTRNWGSGSFDLYVMPSRGGEPRRLTFDGREIQGSAWLDNRNIIFSSNREGNFRLWQISRSSGRPVPFSAAGRQPQWPAISRDGRLLAFVEPVNDASIWRFALAKNDQPAPEQSFISSAGKDYSPTYSPDGKKIAFVSDRSGSTQIWISDSDGLNVMQLTNFKGSTLGSPRWSPDSRRIVLDCGMKSDSSIWLVDSDGSNLHRLNNSTAYEFLPTWSRDGRWIYFCSSRNGRNGLWKQAPDSGQLIEVAQDFFFDVTESPDGRMLYAQRQHGGIWQVPAEGGTPVAIPELAGVYPARYWALAGDTLYFVHQQQLPHKLEAFNLVTRKFQTLATLSSELMVGTSGLSVSPKGDWLLVVQRDQRRSTIMLQER